MEEVIRDKIKTDVVGLNKKLKEIFGADESTGLINHLISLAFPSDEYPNKANGFFWYDKGKAIPCYYELANYFKNELKVKCDHVFTYFFNGRYYEAKSDSILKKTILMYIEAHEPSSRVIDEFMKIVKVVCLQDCMDISNGGLINLHNGVYDVANQKLLEHDPKYNFLYCLPYEYNPIAECPRFQRFLAEILNEDQDLVDIIYEFCGYVLEGGKPYLQKALLMYGDGNNGKSTLMGVMRNLFGKDNVSAVKPEELKQRFQIAGLYGKIANITEEFNTDKVDSDYFKEVVGGATVSAEYKNKPFFSFDNKARFLISTNQIPRFADATCGLTRRLLMVPFDYYVTVANHNLEDELLNELSGIFNLCMVKLEVLKGRGKFKEHKVMNDLIDEYKVSNDSVFAFFSDKVEFNPDSIKRWRIHELYQEYCLYASDNGMMKVSSKLFGQRFNGHIKALCRSKSVDFRSVHKRDKRSVQYLSLTLNTGGF